MNARAYAAFGLMLGTLMSSTTLHSQQVASADAEAEGLATVKSVLERRAGLFVHKVSLAAALTRLSETSGVVLAFSPSLAREVSRKVSCDCRELTVGETLAELLEGTRFGFTEVKGQVMIFLSSPEPAIKADPRFQIRTGWPGSARFVVYSQGSRASSVNSAAANVQTGIIVGRVTDSQTGDGVSGASVSLKDTRWGTLTGDDGRYRLANVSPGPYTLLVRRVGYARADRAVMVVEGEQAMIDIALRSAPTELAEVVVTAQKRDERLIDVPLSIAVVTPEEIDRRGLVSAEDYLRGIPGVNQATDPLGSSVIIRGIETTPTAQNFSSGTTVATYFGETPTTSSAGLAGNTTVDLKLVDIERVEVLRGPQGTAFGNASLGGAVRIIPVAPKLDRYEGKVATSYSLTSGTGGDNNNIQAVINVPLIKDKIAIRATGYRYNDSGFYRNRAGSDPGFQEAVVIPYDVQAFATDQDRVGGTDFTGGRVSASYRASDRFKFTVSYLTQTTEVNGFALATTGTFDQAVLQIAPEHVIRGKKGGLTDTDIDIANAMLEYEVGWADLLATYSYVNSGAVYAYPYTAIPMPFPISQLGEGKHRAHSGEIRLTTRLAGAWNFLAGLYAEALDDETPFEYYWQGSPESNFFGSDRFLGLYVDERNLKQKAAFAEASWKLLPGFTLTGGMRAYEYERTGRVETTGAFFGEDVTTMAAEASGTSFRANLSYKLTDNALVYGAWSQGFRLGKPQPGLPSGLCDRDGDGIVDGTTNVTIESTKELKSDRVNNYEVGSKFTLFNRLIIAADAYRIDWSGVPVRVVAPPRPEGCALAYVANAGSAKSRGIEFQANFYATDAFRVDAGGSWVRARLTEDAPALNASAGAKLPGTPEFNASLGLQYELPIGARKAFVRADQIYIGRFYGELEGLENTKAGGYLKVDVSARLPIRNFNIDLFARNLNNADDFTFRGVRDRGESFGYRLRPRTIGLQLGYDF